MINKEAGQIFKLTFFFRGGGVNCYINILNLLKLSLKQLTFKMLNHCILGAFEWLSHYYDLKHITDYDSVFSYRKLIGHFYYLSISFVPALTASYVAILLERKSRYGPIIFIYSNLC